MHHFDADKGNCARWNLMALCQACHLSVQARVDPRIPLLFEPSPWAFPYIAGVFAAGVCAPLPGYTLAAWVEKYQDQVGAWPAWAVKPDACWGVMR